MKTLRVMDKTGDTPTRFEPGTAAEAEARELFDKLRSQGARVFALSPDRPVTKFEDLGTENVAVPRIVGG